MGTTSAACFENQGFIVTGGTHPLGRSVIALAAQRGAQVVFSSPFGDEQGCAQILADARSAGDGERVSGIALDLSREQDADRLLDAATERLPQVRGLVSVFAGSGDHEPESLSAMTLADWNQAVTAELRAAFLVSQRVLQEFIGNGKGGRIVYLVAGPRDEVGPAAHLTMLHALRSLCRSITKEYGRREITCNIVVAQGQYERVTTQSESIAETVLFLASDEASFVNGEVVLSAGAESDVENRHSFGGVLNVER
jgi:NAD(P)-dependent dehydrogenase (short-subunit alcohol dehydrogenase family)